MPNGITASKTQNVKSTSVRASKQFNGRMRRTGAATMSRTIDAITAASDIQVLFGASGHSPQRRHTL